MSGCTCSAPSTSMPCPSSSCRSALTSSTSRSGRRMIENLIEREESAFLPKRHQCGYDVLTFLCQQAGSSPSSRCTEYRLRRTSLFRRWAPGARWFPTRKDAGAGFTVSAKPAHSISRVQELRSFSGLSPNRSPLSDRRSPGSGPLTHHRRRKPPDGAQHRRGRSQSARIARTPRESVAITYPRRQQTHRREPTQPQGRGCDPTSAGRGQKSRAPGCAPAPRPRDAPSGPFPSDSARVGPSYPATHRPESRAAGRAVPPRRSNCPFHRPSAARRTGRTSEAGCRQRVESDPLEQLGIGRVVGGARRVRTDLAIQPAVHAPVNRVDPVRRLPDLYFVPESEREHGPDGAAHALDVVQRPGQANRLCSLTPAATSGCASCISIARPQPSTTTASRFTWRAIIIVHRIGRL